MKRRIIFLVPLTALILVAGCKTTETKTKPISWSQQKAYLKKLRDPRVYGLRIYDTPRGPEIRDGGRLHPERATMLPMKAKGPARPVVEMGGAFSKKEMLLLDPASSKNWLEFDLAQKLGAHPVGERDPYLIQMPGEEVTACLSVLSTMRPGEIFIENPLVYVRFATGSLGPLHRGIIDPEICGVVGWDLLKKFERVQFLYSINQVALFTTESYEPDPSEVVTTIPLVPDAEIAIAYATVNGKKTVVLLDPAGDFEVATDGAVAVESLQLGDGLTLKNPVVSESPGGVRIGAQLLQKYDVSFCPQEGVVYLEGLSTGEEK